MVAYNKTVENNETLYADIDDFIYYLRQGKGSTDNTVQAYIRNLSRFAEHLKKHKIFSFNDAGEKEIASYKEELEKEGFSNSSISQSLSAIRSMYSFLLSVSAVSVNPAKSVHNKKQEQSSADILSKKELDKLLSMPDMNDAKGLRDKAMIEILYSTGLKASELVSLDTECVDFAMFYIRCSTNRYVELNSDIADVLKLYLERSRPAMVRDVNENALFVNISGDRMTRQGLWKIIKTYAADAGINKTVTPHTLRHSFAAHLIEKGETVDEIKDRLGHSDIYSTVRYTQRLNVRQRRKTASKAENLE